MLQIFKYQISTWRGAINQFVLQIASIFGAIGMIAMFDDIYEIIFVVEFTFGGFLEPFVQIWRELFRPAMNFLALPLEYVVALIFKVEFEVPNFILDYLGVGMTLLFARWRASVGGWKGGIKKAASGVVKNPKKSLSMIFETIFVWPTAIYHMIKNLLFADSLFSDRSSEEIAQIKLSHLLGLSPALISIFLLTANWTYSVFLESSGKFISNDSSNSSSVFEEA